MPDSLPPITPAQRQRLQKLWEEARGLIAQAGAMPSRQDGEKIHELLLECAATDPGNTVYVDALLMNLRALRPKSKSGLLSFLSPPLKAYKSFTDATRRGDPAQTLQRGPAALREAPKHCHVPILIGMADACAASDQGQAEIRYLQEAIHYLPEDPALLTQLVRSLMRQGRFDEARAALESFRSRVHNQLDVQDLLAILNGDVVPQEHESARTVLPALREAVQADPDSPDHHLALAAALVELGQFDEAEAAVAKAQSLSGGDLHVREQGEEIPLARLRRQVEIARRLVEHEPSPAHQETLQRWEEELSRLETATLNARSERFPQDMALKLELAVRLKRASNYSGAIQRLDEIPAETPVRPSVLIELGECWQHLRQFEKALDYYKQAIAAAEGQPEGALLKLALYRAGLLASALNQRDQARAWLERLVALDPDFKDGRRRLLLL